MKILDIDAHRSMVEGVREEFWENIKKAGIDYRCLDELEREKVIELEVNLCSNTEEILSGAEKSGIPVLLKGETLDDVARMAEKYPDLRLITGGFFCKGLVLSKAAEVMKKYPQVYFCLSGGIGGGNYVLHEWIKQFDTDRLLFGSAYPYGNPASRLASVKWELRDTSLEVQEGIFYKNAEALLWRKR